MGSFDSTIEIVGRTSLCSTLSRVRFRRLPLRALALNKLLCVEDDSLWTRIGQGNDIPAETGTAETYATARRWLAECDRDHSTCNANLTNMLPQRVIDLGASGFLDEMRLMESSPNQRARYVTLSHCWGHQQPLATTLATYTQRQAGISWDDMPLTFKHAVEFTKQIGVRYLWIDSLCIIQDSTPDWDTQAANMASIYRNSYLTIAASSAKGPHDGFFYTLPAELRLASEVFSSPPGETPSYSVRARKLRRHGGGKLHSRAWAYQELLLPPRIIQCGATEILWQCFEKEACECNRPYRWDGMQQKRHHSQAFAPTSSEEERILRWHQVVKDYTARDITFENDRFPALSGLVSQYAALQPDTSYLAGLWKHSLGRDLLWRKVLNDEYGRPEGSTAPSWSWASVTGSVTYDICSQRSAPTYTYASSKAMNMHVQIVEATTQPTSSNNPFGQVSSATLSLEGSLRTGVLEYKNRSDLESYRVCAIKFLGSDGHYVRPKGTFRMDFALHVPGPDHVSSGTTVECFKVASTHDTAYCMVLLPQRRHGRGNTYTRIGLLEYWINLTTLDWFHDISKTTIKII